MTNTWNCCVPKDLGIEAESFVYFLFFFTFEGFVCVCVCVCVCVSILIRVKELFWSGLLLSFDLN